MRIKIVASIISIILILNSVNAMFSWENWAKNQKCNIKEIFYPKNKQDIINFIKHNQDNNIRIIASGHSWSDLICGNRIKNINYMSISNLDNIIKIDKNKKTIKVEAGITLKKLNEYLDKYDMSLPNQAAIMNQTIAGAISTATHGTGKTGSMSSFVKELEIIDGTGRLRVLTSVDDLSNYKLFQAATTGIGSLGVIYSITIDIVDQFYLKSNYLILDKKDFLQKYKELYFKHDFMQFSWSGEKSEVIVYLFDKASKEENNLNNVISFKAISSYDTGGERLEEEISIPESEFEQSIMAVQNLIDNYKSHNNYFRVPNIFCRFVKSDNSNLSMTSNRNSIFLSISTPVDDKYLDFYRKFENVLLPYKGRPHWGKINFVDYDKALKLYDQNFIKFLEAKRELDPNNIFDNNYTLKLFNKEYTDYSND